MILDYLIGKADYVQTYAGDAAQWVLERLFLVVVGLTLPLWIIPFWVFRKLELI